MLSRAKFVVFGGLGCVVIVLCVMTTRLYVPDGSSDVKDKR